MDAWEWQLWTATETVKRRAAGRRRYNAMRRRRAEARRAAMAEALEGMGPAAWLFSRGLAPAFARAFGVSRQTAWRDLQQILYGPREYNFYRKGEALFTIHRAYPGGPIVSVTDPDGNEIRGQARRRIIKSLPRYLRRR